jgi:hypothetical protein
MTDHATPEDHDVEPAGPARLDPDEPHTPNWLTALGGALFLLAALFFLATAGDDPVPGAATGTPAAEGAAAPGHPPADDPPSEE